MDQAGHLSERRHDRVVVEADGGSRGNPGEAGFGAVLKDAVTGEVIAEHAERIGVATNNVAEYRGLLCGLELYRQHADGADLEVRMDSKLVVEQMSGRWKIKHADLKPLALQASRLAPPGVRYTWVPRAENAHADRLANEALDGPVGHVVSRVVSRVPQAHPVDEVDVEAVAPAVHPVAARRKPPTPPWEQGPPTTLVLVRHGETAHTRERRFAGRDGADPELSEEGQAQVRATAAWLAALTAHDPVLVSSPMRRTRETAAILGEHMGIDGPELEPGLLEADFGDWEGLTYAEVLERDPERFTTWFEDLHQPAGGHGDSVVSMAARMRETSQRLRERYAGRTVVAATHLTPIKLLAHEVLDLPLTSLFRTEVAPASVTVLAWYPDGRPVLRLLNGRPGDTAFSPAVPVR